MDPGDAIGSARVGDLAVGLTAVTYDVNHLEGAPPAGIPVARFGDPAHEPDWRRIAAQITAAKLAGGDLVWSTDAADGALRTLAVTSDLVIGVRAGSRPGLVAFDHDPDGTLVRIASPTTIDPGRLAANAALAAVPVVVVLLLLGRALAGRVGPVRIGQPAPRDPLEEGLDERDGSDR